jgi:ABC-type phosphate transport system substrate-binding protein
MSRTFSAPRWGSSAARAGVLALILATLAAVCLTPKADAAFNSGKCAGFDIAGRGASFAKDAHSWFNQHFKHVYCVGTPGQSVLDVSYDAAGSGAGRNSMKVRNDTPRFGMTDEPPDPTETLRMNKGTLGNPNDPLNPDVINTSDDGEIHVIPAAVGAVAPLVNFPNNCNPELLEDEYRTVSKAEILAEPAKKALLRVRFPKKEFEEAWAQGAPGGPGLLNWDDVFTELQADTDCDVPIIRVVRFDNSGTTFAFKDYLDRIEPARKWLQDFGGSPNTVWPGAKLEAGGQCSAKVAPGKEPDNVDHLTSGCANGNLALVPKLAEVDGSIGYSDIATARGGGLAVNPSAASAPTTPYWTQAENGSDVFTEPTLAANGFRTDGKRGSNCNAAGMFTNEGGGKPLPSTLGDWSKVSGVDADSGFGICTLTYGLVFDDNADVWGNKEEEEKKARTVRDYWESILTSTAQKGLEDEDYGQLPASILTIAKAGVALVDWGPGAGPPGGGPGGGGGAGGGGGGGVLPIAPPSSKFSLPRKTISSKTGDATISVKLPGPGKVVLLGTAKAGKKQIKVGQVVLNASKAGTFSLKLRPSGAAMKVLREKGQLRVALKVTFTPTGGSAGASTSSVTLKLSKKGR